MVIFLLSKWVIDTNFKSNVMLEVLRYTYDRI